MGLQAHLLDDIRGACTHGLAAEPREDEDKHPAHQPTHEDLGG